MLRSSPRARAPRPACLPACLPACPRGAHLLALLARRGDHAQRGRLLQQAPLGAGGGQAGPFLGQGGRRRGGGQEVTAAAQVRALQEPRLLLAAQGPQALLHVAGLPVQEVQPDRREATRDGRPGEQQPDPGQQAGAPLRGVARRPGLRGHLAEVRRFSRLPPAFLGAISSCPAKTVVAKDRLDRALVWASPEGYSVERGWASAKVTTPLSGPLHSF